MSENVRNWLSELIQGHSEQQQQQQQGEWVVWLGGLLRWLTWITSYSAIEKCMPEL